MSASDLLNQLHNTLEAAVDLALAHGDYELAAHCASAIDATKKWEQSGLQGLPPPDAQQLSGGELILLAQEPSLESTPSHDTLIPPASQRAASKELPSFDVDINVFVSMSQVDQALEAQLERGKRSLSDGKFTEAIADFETVAERAESSDLRVSAQRYLKQAERSQYEKINKAIDQARKHGRAQRRNFKGRRAQWETVLTLDSDNQEALEAIKEIETAEFEQSLRLTIDELRKPLQVRDKRISDVEAARNEASELLAGGQIRDPDLIAEVRVIYAKLDEWRNKILRASEGATAAERSGNYEYAMSVYRKAILNGLTEIIDDALGTPVDPVAALRRTRMAYFEDLKKRAAQSYEHAKATLAAGVPEVALHWLKEAQELLGKVEEGGEYLRRDIRVLMDQVNLEIDQKRGAEKLVFVAQNYVDPAEARLLLMRAQQIYPAYPDIDRLIQGKESLVLLKIINDMTQDIANADDALRARKFYEACQHCNQALSRGLNLETSNDELRAKRREAEQMLRVIAEQEKNLAGLMNKLLKIDQSLERGDLRVAQRMFDLLTPEERNSPEGLERLARLQLAHEDAQSGEVKRAEQEIASPA
ncbi:MAG: hypothetical protein WA040_19550 [Anaerolineae bacterium]